MAGGFAVHTAAMRLILLLALTSLAGLGSQAAQAQATSCTDRPGLLADGLVYGSTGASARDVRLGESRPGRVRRCGDSKTSRTSVLSIAGVDRRIAVAARAGGSRRLIFSRAGFLAELADHPLQRRDLPVSPAACARWL